jgi:hypothetical protein
MASSAAVELMVTQRSVRVEDVGHRAYTKSRFGGGSTGRWVKWCRSMCVVCSSGRLRSLMNTSRSRMQLGVLRRALQQVTTLVPARRHGRLGREADREAPFGSDARRVVLRAAEERQAVSTTESTGPPTAA